jgi:ubiquinone biosynthesis protein UbiJ
VQAARDFAAWQVDAAARIGEAMRDYLTQERAVLMHATELEGFAAAVRGVSDAVDRLEKRIQRLA